jgi:hypothetical protein
MVDAAMIAITTSWAICMSRYVASACARPCRITNMKATPFSFAFLRTLFRQVTSRTVVFVCCADRRPWDLWSIPTDMVSWMVTTRPYLGPPGPI